EPALRYSEESQGNAYCYGKNGSQESAPTARGRHPDLTKTMRKTLAPPSADVRRVCRRAYSQKTLGATGLRAEAVCPLENSDRVLPVRRGMTRIVSLQRQKRKDTI